MPSKSSLSKYVMRYMSSYINGKFLQIFLGQITLKPKLKIKRKILSVVGNNTSKLQNSLLQNLFCLKISQLSSNNTQEGDISEIIKSKNKINMVLIKNYLFWETGGLWWQQFERKTYQH